METVLARPFKCREVAAVPGTTYFKPAGIPMRYLEEIHLSVEELEALRLKDIEGLEQEEAAACMKISRPTFQRVLYSAHRKVAVALFSGKAIRIEGGNFEVSNKKPSENREKKMNAGEKMSTMKIAVITDDGKTISKHFGRAPYYTIVTVENGKIVKKEQRQKAGHHTFGDHSHEGPATHGERHGYDAESHSKHATMAETMADSTLLIAGGMGWGAYDSLKRMGIETIITDVDDIDEAVGLYLQGRLVDLSAQRLH